MVGRNESEPRRVGVATGSVKHLRKEMSRAAVKLRFVPVPLHIVAVEEFVTDGKGFTVTVMVNGLPTHEPAVEVGVTIYCTDPAVVVLGLVSV